MGCWGWGEQFEEYGWNSSGDLVLRTMQRAPKQTDCRTLCVGDVRFVQDRC